MMYFFHVLYLGHWEAFIQSEVYLGENGIKATGSVQLIRTKKSLIQTVTRSSEPPLSYNRC